MFYEFVYTWESSGSLMNFSSQTDASQTHTDMQRDIYVQMVKKTDQMDQQAREEISYTCMRVYYPVGAVRGKAIGLA